MYKRRIANDGPTWQIYPLANNNNFFAEQLLHLDNLFQGTTDLGFQEVFKMYIQETIEFLNSYLHCRHLCKLCFILKGFVAIFWVKGFIQA